MRKSGFSSMISNKTLRNIFLVYIVILALYIVFYFYFGFNYFLSGSNGLVPELYRSLGGNLLFFGILGLATLIPSFRDPREEPIERRLSFLITSKKVSQTALSFIRNEITLLCGYYERSETNLIIRDYDHQNGVMKVERRSEYVMKNTFAQEEYVDRGFMFTMSPDHIKDHEGQYGEVIQVEVHEREKTIFSLKTPIVLKTSGVFKMNIPAIIEKDGTLKLSLIFWILCTTNVAYFIGFRRYCDYAMISITNGTQLCLDIVNDCNGEGDFMLPPEQSRVVHQGPLEPGRKSIFRIRRAGAIES